MHQTSKRTSAARTVALALCAAAALCSAPGRATAVPTLEQLMADFDFGPGDVQKMRDGEMVKTTTKETSEKELATVMAFCFET